MKIEDSSFSFGFSVAWYLPILEPFLAENFSLTTFATGAMVRHFA